MFYISFKPFSYARLSDAPAVLLRATVMMCWLLTFGTAHADFAGGDGSESNPWEIATAEQLNDVRNSFAWGVYFELVADIDLSESDWKDGWTPIGDGAEPFEGTFDGKDHSIRGLIVNAPENVRAGLFGRLDSATIQNLNLVDVQVTGYGWTGGLAGSANRSTIADVSVSGSIAAASTTGSLFGGLVGAASWTTITDSHFSGTVSGLYETGGLVGRVSTTSGIPRDSIIRDSSVDATVTGGGRTGGLVGYLLIEEEMAPDNVVLIERSHAHGSVSGDYSVGGLVGESQHASVENSHAGGQVNGNVRTGGLVGYVTSQTEISESYFAGQVAGGAANGGLIGELNNSTLQRSYVSSTVQGANGNAALVATIADGTVKNSFWQEALVPELSAFFETSGLNTFEQVSGLTASQLKNELTFSAAGWDFATVWVMAPGGFPFQQWAPEFDTNPPVLVKPLEDMLLLAGNNLAVELDTFFQDPQGGELSYQVTGLPDGIVFDSAAASISGETHIWGDHVITIEARTDLDERLEASFTVTFLPYTSGDGTSGFGWRVENAEQLRAMRLRPDDHYFLVEDIDLNGEEWIPAGTSANPFTGTLTGNDYTIRGLVIDTTADEVGLFGVTQGATLSSIRIESATISGGKNVGILAGRASNTTINQVSVAGSVTAESDAGGIAATLTDSAVSEAHVFANVSAGSNTGGLAVVLQDSQIRDSQVAGSVTAAMFLGGISAQADGSTIINTYADTEVAGADDGMFVGNMAGFATNSTYANVYWNSNRNPELTIAVTDFGGVELTQVSGRTPDDLRDLTLYPVLPDVDGGWDFDTIWDIDPNINDGLPYLRWMAPNAMPTLTQFDSAQLVIDEDTSLWLRHHILMDASDAADEDGGVAAFVVKSVVSGSLLINEEPYDAVSNSAIDLSVGAHWTPAANANGLLPALRMVVRDNRGLESATEVLLSVQVTPVNDAPVLVTPIPNQSGTQGEAFSLDLATYFDDVDEDTLQFVVTGLPEGLGVTAAGLVSGTPTNAAALNSPYTITVTVSDDSESVSDSFELLVINVNDAPVLLGTINDQAVSVGAALDMDVSVYFEDPDHDDLTFSAHGLPTGLSITGAGMISGSAAQAGSFTITITAEDPDGANVDTTFALVVSAAPVSEPESEAPVVDSEQNNVNQSGIITVTESGVLNGGNITGTINNSGTVTGTINLGAGSVINGGQISGTIRGNASQPARINNATIAPGSVLENVIINADVVLGAGVELGSNVRFSSANNIPPAIDLTPALSKLQWSVGDEREVMDLGGDVLTPDNGAMSIIRSIQLMSDFEPAGNQAVQDEGNGEIRVIMSDTRHTVLPVKVSQATPEDEEGVYINSDGDIVLVTATRRVVVNHPVLDSNPAFREALAAMGLELAFDARTNLIVSETSAATLMFSNGAQQATVMALNSAAVPGYYAGRPDVSAVPAHRSDVPGIHSFTVPGLVNVEALSLIFAADDGTLLEQDIAPVPAHWSELKQSLQLLPGASDVRIDTLGVISLVLDGQNVRGRADYRVERHPDHPSGTDYVAFDPAGDVNGDGTDDFLLRYPNGDRQLLYVYP